MTLIASKSWESYCSLCRALERMEIRYEKNDKELSVKCAVSGCALEQKYRISIDPSKMLMTLFAPLPLPVTDETAGDLAIAASMVNHSIRDGCLCIDFREGLMYLRLTASFYESAFSGTVFEYMLSTAADILDEYFPKLSQLASLVK